MPSEENGTYQPGRWGIKIMGGERMGSKQIVQSPHVKREWRLFERLRLVGRKHSGHGWQGTSTAGAGLGSMKL